MRKKKKILHLVGDSILILHLNSVSKDVMSFIHAEKNKPWTRCRWITSSWFDTVCFSKLRCRSIWTLMPWSCRFRKRRGRANTPRDERRILSEAEFVTVKRLVISPRMGGGMRRRYDHVGQEVRVQDAQCKQQHVCAVSCRWDVTHTRLVPSVPPGLDDDVSSSLLVVPLSTERCLLSPCPVLLSLLVPTESL